MRTDWVWWSVVRVGIVALLLVEVAYAQGARDLTGTWQGTLSVGGAERIVVNISKDGARWHGTVYDLDSRTPSEGRNTTQMSFLGGGVRFAIATVDASYSGKLSEDGTSFAGTWTQGGQAHPLNLARAKGDAAWEIPATTVAMAKGADPDWEVVTVRPTDPAINNASIRMNGRQFVLQNRTVETLLLAGYGVHKKQIINARDWIRTERWDAKGIPDVPGQPNFSQMQTLVRKLMIERFGMVTHTEKREMEVYALTVAKGGERMMPSPDDQIGLPDESDRENGGERTMQATHMSMADFALTMNFFLDRPVVDRTGLTGRYDFRLQWTFDDTRAPSDSTSVPTLFTAIGEQIGLKLEPVKAPLDVLRVDKLEHPSVI